MLRSAIRFAALGIIGIWLVIGNPIAMVGITVGVLWVPFSIWCSDRGWFAWVPVLEIAALASGNDPLAEAISIGHYAAIALALTWRTA